MKVKRYTIKVDNDHYWLKAEEPGLRRKAYLYFDRKEDVIEHLAFLVEEGLDAESAEIISVTIDETI